MISGRRTKLHRQCKTIASTKATQPAHYAHNARKRSTLCILLKYFLTRDAMIKTEAFMSIIKKKQENAKHNQKHAPPWLLLTCFIKLNCV